MLKVKSINIALSKRINELKTMGKLALSGTDFRCMVYLILNTLNTFINMPTWQTCKRNCSVDHSIVDILLA